MFEALSDGLMSDVGLCLSVFKGPTACYPCYPRSRFGAFFWVSFFDVILEANGHHQGPQNRLKSSKIVFQRPPWEPSQKIHQKWSEKSFFRKAGYAIRARLCSPNTLFRFHFPVAQGSQKGAKKLPKMELLGTQNHKKTRKPNIQKNTKRMMQKVSKKEPKTRYPFAAERSPKS